MRISISACLAVLLLGGSAWANDQKFQPGVTGDWGGARSDLQNQGWQFQLRGIFEGADNPSGGERQAAAGAGEMDFAALADLGTLVGDDGGSLEAKLTDRFGANLVTAAGLHSLMQPQEIWGRGDIWRLTQLSFQQSLWNKALIVEVGRNNPGSDFDVFSCNFQNLNFCGAPPGAFDADYWYDSPVSQWEARLLASIGALSAQIGFYQINPVNLTRGFSFDFAGGKGALIPYKLEWKPSLIGGLPGDYQIGGWYSTMRAPDVFYDVHHAPSAVSGASPLPDRGRAGFFFSARQQVTGAAPPQGAPAGTNGKGLTLFVNYTGSDRRTSLLDSQFAVGAIYKGAVPGRPDDEIALAFGGTHVNGRVATGEQLHNAAGLPFLAVQHAEHVTELDYRAIIVPGLELSPNLQIIVDPGGVKSRSDVVVLGLKTALTL